ncbi:Rod shape-determining protein RodA [Candidatus Arsenophonus lipoptenae]|uniref:Peptidoglycan glycosyltransferase MrdB n=1 Tax=Candidatus Arsenophonus lipoptenae TaxID=634113 RepID=A0A0X9VEV9_9GAMM|nr:peptidoglycan glycosyltransferase MrdB [Candidatus Arsenophonus lipoptenae]AMA65139.1 Rod shape-determining protein RodA [Candidatus Arsenophonus lipoptenae]
MNDNLNKLSLSKWLHLDITMLLIICSLIIYSVVIMWSASGQNIDMMQRKCIQILIGFILMIIMAQISPRIYENWAPHLYFFSVILLLFVDAYGQISKGAQRWLDIGFIRFQPSEITKISVPLMVARFVNRDIYPPTLKNTLLALILIFLPALLVAAQPDLGTSILIIASGLFILFLAGMDWKLITISFIGIACFIPILWYFLMHDYQRIRITTILLNPEMDPLRSGYHIIQSKIAIGSGGLFGKGWLHGTQSQLEFLPERHTDFIFAVLSEEFGLIGVIILLTLYLLLIIRGFIIAANAQNTFGRVMVGGLILIFFTYIFINIGMVSGILPIVGIPLPLLSYGGSALIVLMSGFGIIMSIHTHRKFLSKNL